VSKALVIVGTNAKMAAAYDATTGKRAWIRKLDGPSTFGPLLFRSLLGVVTNSIYLIRPDSGKVVRRFSWKDDGVSQAECTHTGIVAILRGSSPDGNVTLVSLNENGVRFTEVCRAFVAFLRYVRETRLIYISHLEGIDLRHPKSGVLLCKIERSDIPEGSSLVDVKQNTIYALTGDGNVYALRHPNVRNEMTNNP